MDRGAICGMLPTQPDPMEPMRNQEIVSPLTFDDDSP